MSFSFSLHRDSNDLPILGWHRGHEGNYNETCNAACSHEKKTVGDRQGKGLLPNLQPQNFRGTAERGQAGRMRSKRMLKPEESVIGNAICKSNIEAKHIRMELFSNSDEVSHKNSSHLAPKQAYDLEEAGKCQYVCGPCQGPGIQNL